MKALTWCAPYKVNVENVPDLPTHTLEVPHLDNTWLVNEHSQHSARTVATPFHVYEREPVVGEDWQDHALDLCDPFVL